MEQVIRSLQYENVVNEQKLREELVDGFEKKQEVMNERFDRRYKAMEEQYKSKVTKGIFILHIFILRLSNFSSSFQIKDLEDEVIPYSNILVILSTIYSFSCLISCSPRIKNYGRNYGDMKNAMR